MPSALPPNRRSSTLRLAIALASACALAAACALTAACAGPPASTIAVAGWNLSAATPAPKGDLQSFSWALYAEPPTLDWISAYDYPENEIDSNICTSLEEWTPQLKEVPGLAESARNPSPLTWIYDLRPGVHFSDGTRMTAADAVFSMERTWHDPNSDWGQIYQNVKSVTATGPLQVTVKLLRPDAMFNQYMATSAGVVASAAGVKAAGASYGTSGSLDCAGPYELGSWIKGQSITLNRVSGYWGGEARSTHVTFLFITDPDSLANALLTGEADGGYLIPPQSYAKLTSSGVGTLYYGQSLTTVNINIDNLKGVLGNVKVREALSLALDREGFVQAGLDGVGSATDSLTPRAVWAAGGPPAQAQAGPDLSGTAPDIAAATKLIKQAGATGATVTLATSPIGPDTSLLPTALQAAGEQIGLNVVLKTVSPDGYTALFSDAQARAGIDMFPETYYLSISDPYDLLSAFQAGDFQNYADFSDPAYNTLISEAVATYNTPKRLGIEARANQIAARQLPWIPVAEWPNAMFMNKKITGAPTSIAYMYYPWAASVGAAR
ncbi:MAG TPA: ABC transporter substrate-binding protein [Streptosporangiaceae bacterium]|jgi:peptide/nickel transport system substrate-binding protein